MTTWFASWTRIAGRIASSFSRNSKASVGESRRSPGLRTARPGLSPRELEVLALVARGASNKEIARRLHISQATVKTHLIHVFGKLLVDDRTAAVTRALERGCLRLES